MSSRYPVNEDTAGQPAGREIVVSAYGDTAEGIEAAALDEAQAAFGAGVQLEVVRAYRVFPTQDGRETAGRKYHADVTVRVTGE